MEEKLVEYQDPLHLNWIVLDGNFQRLVNSDLAVRARDITMGTVPNAFRMNGALPSRFHHNIGSYLLTDRCVRANNQELFSTELGNLYRAAAMMHDWGNGPFAHLTERLMKIDIGYNGETFLQVLLDSEIGKSAKSALNNMGVDSETLVKLISGNLEPYSKLVHGDLDVDNLDNVYRYAMCANLKGKVGCPSLVATNFKWSEEQQCWGIEKSDLQAAFKKNLGIDIRKTKDSVPEVLLDWKKTRRMVYRDISEGPHIIVGTMLFSALWQAHAKGCIGMEDYFGTDTSMIRLLSEASPVMMDKIVRMNWFEQVARSKTTEPSEKMKQIAGDSMMRMELADRFAIRYGIDINQVTVYVGIDGMERAINVPVFGYEGVSTVEELLVQKFPDDPEAVTQPRNYRVHINLDRSVADGLREQAHDFIIQEIW
ncbi:hypothetical protein IPM19_04805 [bacterium]|nr:MAG: hypothetical protein IPM19_04805 [bacterium]